MRVTNGPNMKKYLLSAAAALFALGLASSGYAQYIWLDKNNVKHYSDKAPPSDIPNSRILKSPRGQPARSINDSPPNSATPAAPASSTQQQPMTTAEKNADFNKRKMERAEKEKKAEAERKNKEAKAQNCERAREYQRSLKSGQRIVRTKPDGEREYVNDEDRAREAGTVDEALKDCN